ncbi:MAG: hypothetical protein KDC98_20525 [Planctomycetes bacterium]|nr:hypothetical protein [Planctomycetota bacterium]
MNPRPGTLLMAAVLLTGCGRDPGAAQAMAVVDELQAAFCAGDQGRCRKLLTIESAAALPELPWHELRRKQPVTVLGASRRHLGYFVDVSDPNAGGRRGRFVVVPENGHPVVDLVASAGLTFEERVGEDAREELAPRELTPADYDRIRQHELARPWR